MTTETRAWSIGAIREANRAAGRYFFEPDTMRFFASKVLSHVYQGDGGVFFVTSERRAGGSRKYSVRRFNPATSDVTTVGGFNDLTLSAARGAASQHACSAA